ncbi:MAG: MBL fold metallo-hydrolase [Lachnospiraceae bacterium]|nr:MBL fold metallo-hydrolase [Lachnospiraceae bacterium]
MFKITPIASGSSGNCICLSNDDSAILIDAGVSKKKIEEGLKSANILPDNVKGMFVTHEHSDHIKGLGVFTRKYEIPVFATSKTIDYMLESGSLGKVNTSLFNSVTPGTRMQFDKFDLIPFSVSHDAVDPVAYRVESDNSSCAVVTDLGYYDDYIVENLNDLDAVYLEANHDVYMLQTGPYPYSLKQRVWGNKGHLSNETAGQLLSKILSPKLKNVILGHLSNENNYPELAYEAVRNEVNAGEGNIYSNNYHMVVARRDVPTQSIII